MSNEEVFVIKSVYQNVYQIYTIFGTKETREVKVLGSLYFCRTQKYCTASKMMTETHINSNHMLNSGLGPKTDLAKMDDVGWKAKLKIPPKDIRMKTSVSVLEKNVCLSDSVELFPFLFQCFISAGLTPLQNLKKFQFK